MKDEKERGGGRDSWKRKEWKREMKGGGHEMSEMEEDSGREKNLNAFLF
jgi:hypothetical protein